MLSRQGMILTTCILIAEDEPDIRDFLAAVLRSAGHQVVEVANGAEVLVQLAGPIPDLVLLDVNMPLLTGLEALRHLRMVPACDVPVLLLTASGATDDMTLARSLGAQGYLMKPIRAADLLSKVKMILEDQSLLWLDDITQSRAG